jgi:hypothetical protein
MVIPYYLIVSVVFRVIFSYRCDVLDVHNVYTIMLSSYVNALACALCDVTLFFKDGVLFMASVSYLPPAK